MTTIELLDMQFYAHHGCFAEEREIGAHFRVDVAMESLGLSKAVTSDRLEDALNYQDVYHIVSKEMEQPSHLLEHVAGRILKRLQTDFPQVNKIRVTISKINPPLGGQVGASKITLTSNE